MEYFLGQLQIVLPVLGVNAIRVRATWADTAPATPNESPIFTLKNARQGVDASAQQVDGEFIMLSGSVVVPEWHRGRQGGQHSEGVRQLPVPA